MTDEGRGASHPLASCSRRRNDEEPRPRRRRHSRDSAKCGERGSRMHCDRSAADTAPERDRPRGGVPADPGRWADRTPRSAFSGGRDWVGRGSRGASGKDIDTASAPCGHRTAATFERSCEADPIVCPCRNCVRPKLLGERVSEVLLHSNLRQAINSSVNVVLRRLRRRAASKNERQEPRRHGAGDRGRPRNSTGRDSVVRRVTHGTNGTSAPRTCRPSRHRTC